VTTAAELPAGARVAVVRFSAFGDVVLAGAALAELRRVRPDLQIVVLTKPAVAAALPGLEVWPLPSADAAGLRALRARLVDWRPDLVVDLHGTLRARLLRLTTPGLRWQRAPRRAWRRQLWVRFGLPDRAAPHVVERYARPLGVAVQPGPWLDCAVPPQPGRLALAPGARWATKRWPGERWRRLAEIWQARGGKVVWVGGADEADILTAHAAAVGGETAIGLPFGDLTRTLAECAAVVSNDSAPLHVAAGVGRPVVALFGPTVPGFGFWPWGDHEIVEDGELACRPCSLHGSDRCPQGHHACLLGIPPDDVLAALAGLAITPTGAAV
jgi:heptosyltransferase-2